MQRASRIEDVLVKRRSCYPFGRLEVFFPMRVPCVIGALREGFPGGVGVSGGLAAGARLLALAFGLLLVGATSAWADPGSGEGQLRHELRITEPRLDLALNELARQTGEQLLFPFDEASRLPARPVVGRYTLEQALDTLLRGTPLERRLTGGGVMTISPARNNRLSRGNDMYSNANEAGSRAGIGRRRGLAAAVAAALGAMFATSPSAKAQESEQVTELDRMVVTAARRGEQRLIDTPLSISAFDGNWLENRGYTGLKDFIQFSPGVSMTEFSPGMNRIQMRGVSAGVGENNVGYYLDEVPMAFINQVSLPDLRTFDMERIEVLRGPQGTLYGAGALAGVVRTVTASPLLDAYEFKADMSASSTRDGGSNYAGNVAASVPLINDRFGIRVVHTREDNSGWIDQTLLGEEDYNSSDLTATRVKLLGQVTDRLSVSGLYWRSEVDTFSSSVSFRDRTLDEAALTPSTYQYDIANLTLNYDAPGFGLVSSTSRMAMDDASRSDYFGGYSILTLLDPVAFTQEVRAFSTHDDPWQWSAGAFYRNADQTQVQTSEVMPVLGIDPVIQYDKVISRSVFAELTRRMMDGRLELTAGMRALEETRSTEQRLRPTEPFENKFNATTPRFNVTWRPAENWMTYLTFSQGFRSGINQFAVSLETAAAMGVLLPEAAEPEYADSFEFGVKGTFWDNRLTVDASAYQIKWRDMQTLVPVVAGVLYGAVNASSASSPGVELAINLKATQDLQLGLTGSWNDAKIDQDVFAEALLTDPATGVPTGETAPILVFEKGDRINDVPEWTAGFTVDYTRPVRQDGMLFVLRGAAQYASAREMRSFGDVSLGQSNLVVDLRLGVESGGWGLYLFGANLFDERNRVSPYPSGVRSDYGTRHRPRTIGLNFKYFY